MSARSLGVLTLDMAIRTGMFTAGLSKAEKDTQKSLGNIEKRAYAFGKAMGVAIKASAGIAAAGLAIYIKNTIEAEKVQAQLQARIKDTFGAAGRSIEQLNAQADKLQSLTVFDDEAIGGAQAMLLTFKNIQGINFDDATAAVLDMATAMGTDLNSAALQLGKALNDPIQGLSALSRAGIQFSEDQKKVIKALVESGDVAGAQKIILKELEGQMGTAAEAARNTLGGALQGLKNNFDNLLEGDASGGGIKATTEAVNALSDTLADPQIKQSLDNIAGGIANIVAESIQGVSALQKFYQNVNNLFSISQKVKAGAPASAFTDRELEIQLANLSGQKSAARKSGDLAKADALQNEITNLIRENTERLKQELTIKDPALDVALFVREDKDRAATGSDKTDKKAASTRSAAKATKELTEAEKAYLQVMEANAMIDDMVADFRMDQVSVEYAKAKAIEESRKQIDEQIESMAFELGLVGKTNKERQREIELRYAGADATEEQRAAIVALSDANYEAARSAELFDGAWADLGDTFVDFVSGAKSAKEAFGDFADSLYKEALRFVSDSAIQALREWLSSGFNAQNGIGAPIQVGSQTSGGGGWAEALSTLIGFFGGGKEHGGVVGEASFR